jgi:signal transduction histidine kinase
MRNDQHDLQSLTVSYLNIGGLYRTLKQPEKAEEFAKQAQSLALKTGALEDLRDVYELRSFLNEDALKYKEALAFFRSFQKANDSLIRSREEEKMARSELNYELEKRRQNANLIEEKRSHAFQLQAERGMQQRNLFIMAFVCAFIIGILLLFAILRNRRANRLLQEKNEALEEINRQQGALTQILAHDLRTPITQIKGLVGLLDFTGPISPGQREVLDKINMAASGGDQLINDLLKIDFIEQDEQGMKMQDVEIADLLESVCRQFAGEAKRKQMMVVNRYEGDGVLKTNLAFLQQIMNNLLSNAIKFSDFGKMVYLDAERTEKGWILSVTDQGPGIPDEELNELFLKFRRLSNRPTGNETSHGLGLYSVKIIAKKLGGTVTCSSKIGKGSVFRVRL